ncbi:MAG: class I SAM-dependent rRNA methyltransferase [Planctomycetota bacterium]
MLLPRGLVVATAKGRRWLGTGHPWLYRDDVESEQADNGAIVDVRDPAGRHLGRGFYSAVSKITVRMVTRGEDAIDAAFLARRLDQAIAARAALAVESEAYRVVHAEADRLPALVIDRYGEVLVMQATAPAQEPLLPVWLDVLRERFRPRAIVVRHDLPVRRLEGLPLEVRIEGQAVDAPLVVEERGLKWLVDPVHGQKTGLYLDQRANHARARQLCRGKRVLDVFSYQGGFGLSMAQAAEHVTMVDASAEALEVAAKNAALNGIANVTLVKAKAFDDLRRRAEQGERYDVVVLDPPAFAKSRADVEQAMRGYLDINLRALRLLAPGGWLVTCTCSYNLGPDEFRHIVRRAAADAGADVWLIEQGMQAGDHPVLMTFPESWYLKSLFVRRAAE